MEELILVVIPHPDLPIALEPGCIEARIGDLMAAHPRNQIGDPNADLDIKLQPLIRAIEDMCEVDFGVEGLCLAWENRYSYFAVNGFVPIQNNSDLNECIELLRGLTMAPDVTDWIVLYVVSSSSSAQIRISKKLIIMM
jgi:hypothetical protein